MNFFINSNLDVQIVNRMDRACTEVWVFDHGPDADTSISIAEDGLLLMTKIKHGDFPSEELKPFLTLPAILANSLFKAIAENLESRGIKTKDANLIEGKLSATEKHLADMQKISMSLLETLTKKI